MNTSMIESKPAKQAEIRFSVTEETVRPLAEKYLAMKIDGVGDKVGLAAVRVARQEVRKARTTVESERVAAKAEYLEAGRKVDASAKVVVSMLEPIEAHLVSELERIDVENQRLADEKLDRRLAVRMDELDEIGGVPSTVSQQFPRPVIRAMTEEGFKAFLVEMSGLNTRLAAEAKERADVEERNRLEAEKLKEERAELDRLRKAEAERQQAEQKRLAEERRIDDERLAAVRAEERRIQAEEQKRLDEQRAEQRRVADAEQKKLDEQRAAQEMEAARIETERRKLADEQDALRKKELAAIEERRQADAAEAQRLEEEKTRQAMLPHKEKIAAYRDALLAVPVPKLPAKLARAAKVIESVRSVIADKFEHMYDGEDATR